MNFKLTLKLHDNEKALSANPRQLAMVMRIIIRVGERVQPDKITASNVC